MTWYKRTFNPGNACYSSRAESSVFQFVVQKLKNPAILPVFYMFVKPGLP